MGYGCQISMDAKGFASRLVSAGLLRNQGLIGGKWSDAYDGNTIKVWTKTIFISSDVYVFRRFLQLSLHLLSSSEYCSFMLHIFFIDYCFVEERSTVLQ